MTTRVLSPRPRKRTMLGVTPFVWKRAKWFYLFMAPWFIGFVSFLVVPVALGFGMSFTNFSGSNFDTYRFVGLSNYAEAFGEFFTNGDAWYSLQRTILFTLVTIPLSIAISLFLASLLTRQAPARGILRTMFYLPVMLPLVASVWVWKSLMDNNFGVLNATLDAIVPGTHLQFMTTYAFHILVTWSIWAGAGGAIIIFIAGIQGVSGELREAAAVDGAKPVQIFRHITVPLLTPLIMYQVVLGFIGGLQILVAPILLTPLGGGGAGITATTVPVRDNYMFMVHIFQESFYRQRFGYGSALLWIMFVMILIVTLIFVFTSRHWVYYEVDPESKANGSRA